MYPLTCVSTLLQSDDTPSWGWGGRGAETPIQHALTIQHLYTLRKTLNSSNLAFNFHWKHCLKMSIYKTSNFYDLYLEMKKQNKTKKTPDNVIAISCMHTYKE